MELFVLDPQNIRIMAKYYTRITMKRMANLLDLSIDVSSCCKVLTENGVFNLKVLTKYFCS